MFKALKGFEKNARARLSKHPVLYGFIGGIGVVLFWRGIWYMADFTTVYFLAWKAASPMPSFVTLWDGLLSLVLGGVLLLSTGLFVSDFLGPDIVASIVKKEEKLAGETESEVEKARRRLAAVEGKLDHLDSHLDKIEEEIRENKNV